MDYKDIFRPDTLEKLNKRSQENLKKMMGDKTLMQTMMSSTRLLQEIMTIEAPYKDQLEQLAIQMAEDMYPIINEDGINIDAKIVSMGDINKSLDENNLKENSPEAKRRVINGITQGAALHGTFSFYMFKEYLDAIDDTLVEKYNQLMKEVFGVYDDDNAIAMFLQMIAQGQKMGGGSSKVVLQEQQKFPTIQARAICFPMLVHEIIKGLYELVSLQGFQGTKDQNQAVVDKVDKLENEPTDIRYGKFIYDALNDIYVESGYDDSRIREFFFAEVYQLGDQEFVDFVENALNDELTPSQQSWIKQTLKEIQTDLRNDDFDATGLDEIKIESPVPYMKWGEREWLDFMILLRTKGIKLRNILSKEYKWKDGKPTDFILSLPPNKKKEIYNRFKQEYKMGVGEKLNESKSPCWDDYKKQGTKIENGKRVNNYVPVNEAYINNSNQIISKGDFCVIQGDFHGRIYLKDLDKINIEDYIHFENNMNDWNYRNIIRSLTKQFTDLYNNSPLKSINDKLKNKISISPGKIDGVPILYITLFEGITSPPRPYHKSIIPNYFRDFFTNEKLIQKIKNTPRH